jgi:hypothetical protein
MYRSAVRAASGGQWGWGPAGGATGLMAATGGTCWWRIPGWSRPGPQHHVALPGPGAGPHSWRPGAALVAPSDWCAGRASLSLQAGAAASGSAPGMLHNARCAACHVQHALCNMLCTTCAVRHALCNVRCTTCSVQRALHNMLCATCAVQNALHNVRCTTCGQATLVQVHAAVETGSTCYSLC